MKERIHIVIWNIEKAFDQLDVMDNNNRCGKKTKTVQLIGFGTFKIASRKARTGVNPKTGQKIKIKASKTVKFVAGKAFKDSI